MKIFAPIFYLRVCLVFVSFGLCASFAVGNAWSQEFPISLPAPVTAALQRAAIPNSAVGIYVQDVQVQKPWLAQNENVPFNPASTMKLVTTNAALELLGPAFSWKTQAYTNGKQIGDVLYGDLIIKGSGDPKLVVENFWLFLRQIRARGIREIRGNLVLDRTAFLTDNYDPAEFDRDPGKPYNVGPDALLLNYKALRFRFMPNQANESDIGSVINVTVDPPLIGYAIRAPKMVQGNCGDWQSKLQVAIHNNSIRFDGGFPASCGEKTWHVHPYQMTNTQYFEAVFRALWQQLGATLKGQVVDGKLPANARLLAEWSSASLPEIVRDINKYSNNVMAKQVLLTLAASSVANANPDANANTEDGMKVIKTWLNNKGIAAPEMVIENGSGLSRIERISVATIGRMLVAAFQSSIMPEFISSLPIAGYDGTMRRRLQARSVAGNAHIKTGTLNDVRAIAGYVLAASGKRYVVVCLINHDNAVSGKEAQDALLQWLYEKG